jgi:C4-dicarboxylate-specific signal transduction histidine kinase
VDLGDAGVEGGKRALTIVVSDRGTGVPPRHVTELFEPFFTTKSDGTGLGLALSRAIARAHGGALSYRREDAVTRFSLSIDGARVASGAHEENEAAAPDTHRPPEARP